MVRNWVGQIGDDEFYEACDRHGIVVWQDFWLANPWDGPDPGRRRHVHAQRDRHGQPHPHHPSVGLYCGRNEGYPPKPLDDGSARCWPSVTPALPYISSSADDVVERSRAVPRDAA